MEQPVEIAKNIGAVLGTASVVGYACGYLALHARAFALGTDPAFKLVDQVYVFAGARFLIATLIAVLVLAPVMLAVRWAAIGASRLLPDSLAAPIQWIALILVAVMTLLSLGILKANGILLSEGDLPTSGLEGAVLGSATGLRFGLILASVLLAGLSALWLYAHAKPPGSFAWVLAVVVALQAFMLPVYHGALFADRRVRVLSEVPGVVQGLTTPVAIVDRTAEQATLLGQSGVGRRGLATVALKDLDGIPVQAVMSLNDFVGRLGAGRREISGVGGQGVLVADAGTTVGGQIVADDSTGFAKGFYASLAGYFGMVLESIGSLGGGPGTAGELWAVDLDASGRPSPARRVGELSDISWPVVGADGASFVALRGGQVVRLDPGGAVAAVLAEGGGWRKLLGEQDGTVLGLVRQDGETLPAQLAADGSLQLGAAPTTDEERRALARLQQDARAYSGNVALVVDRSERGGRGFDVFLRSANGIVNLSDCGDDYCGQASLSPDRRRAVFVRVPR